MEDTKTIKEKPSSSQLSTGTPPSPRVSSECSYDYVTSSNVSADEMPPRKVKDEDRDEGGDSDWE